MAQPSWQSEFWWSVPPLRSSLLFSMPLQNFFPDDTMHFHWNVLFIFSIILFLGQLINSTCFYRYRCVSPDLMLSSSPESLISDHHRAADNKSPSPMVSPSVMYKLLIPLLRCEVPDMKDSVVHALGKNLDFKHFYFFQIFIFSFF